MTKSELIERISETLKLPNGKAEQIVNCVFDSMVKALQEGDGIEIRGFGSFTVREYKSYEGRNPRTGDTVHVEPKRLPFFKVGKDLRDRVNRGRPTRAQPPPPERAVGRDGASRPAAAVGGNSEGEPATAEEPSGPDAIPRPPDRMVRPESIPLPPLGDHSQGAPSPGSAVPGDPLTTHEPLRHTPPPDNASGSD